MKNFLKKITQNIFRQVRLRFQGGCAGTAMNQQAKSCGITNQIGESCMVVIQNAYSMGIIQSTALNSAYVINPDEFENYQGQVLTGTRLGSDPAHAGFTHSLGIPGQSWTDTGNNPITTFGYTGNTNWVPNSTGSTNWVTTDQIVPDNTASLTNKGTVTNNTGSPYRFQKLDGTDVVIYGSWSGTSFIADSFNFPGGSSGNLDLMNGSFKNFVFHP